MDGLLLNVEQRAYIQSEAAFSQAQRRGLWERLLDQIKGCHDLLSFYDIADKFSLKPEIYRGLQDIPLKNIVGSTGRSQDFTRHFWPRSGDRGNRERWRKIYTLAVTGQGFPPIEVYQIDHVYFVRDGNHRVSVASDLGWRTIQAYVTEFPGSLSPRLGCD